ncbi:unnamed protein product [Gordionus sp. m RMFG-2023]
MARKFILNPSNVDNAITKPLAFPKSKTVKYPQPKKILLASTMAKKVIPGEYKSCNPFFASAQIRLAHTDINFPNFDDYRRVDTLDPESSAKDTHDSRKLFSYLFTAGAGMAGAYSAKNVATKLIYTMSPSADVLAQAQIEVDLSTIPEGKTVILKWRGKPLFIKHRSVADITKEESTDFSSLRDPEPDSARVQKPEWLILIGICTHLGCIPIANAGDYPGGFYCPCHGSHYDGSGRIRKGPAPLNLEVPPYAFTTDTSIVVG